MADQSLSHIAVVPKSNIKHWDQNLSSNKTVITRSKNDPFWDLKTDSGSSRRDLAFSAFKTRLRAQKNPRDPEAPKSREKEAFGDPNGTKMRQQKFENGFESPRRDLSSCSIRIALGAQRRHFFKICMRPWICRSHFLADFSYTFSPLKVSQIKLDPI